MTILLPQKLTSKINRLEDYIPFDMTLFYTGYVSFFGVVNMNTYTLQNQMPTAWSFPHFYSLVLGSKCQSLWSTKAHEPGGVFAMVWMSGGKVLGGET